MLLVKINCDVAKGRPVQRETVMLNKTAVFWSTHIETT
jgi:hypothetical protein